MRALSLTIRRRLMAEQGFTMTEVLLAMMLGLMIVAAGAMLFTTATRTQRALGDRDQAIRDGRVVMERMIREVRQGEALDTGAGDSWSSQSLSFRTYVHSATGCGSQNVACVRRVTYTCTAGSCIRVEADPNTGVGGSPVQVVTGLASSAVFDYRADPSAECAPPPDAPNEAISLRDEATLRNSGPESPSRICISLVFLK